MATTYGPEIANAYKQVWPELGTPIAGSTAPEWARKLRGTGGAPPGLLIPLRLELQAVNRASTY